MEKTFNPCDECDYSFSKQNQESGMCKICEFRKMLDLEEQGRSLKLPCAVGDAAWIVFEGEIFKCMVSKFDIVRNGIFPMLRINETLETISVSMKTLKKTWFLTKEAAEAAMSE